MTARRSTMTAGQRLILAGIVSILAGSPAAAADRFQVIVHQAHPGRAITRTDLASVFLKRATSWADGTEIVAVDQSLESTVRQAFTGDVLLTSSMEVLYYWRDQIRKGRQRPPQVKSSDDEVIAFVAATPGAIGYISESTQPTGDVKVVRVVASR